MVFLTIRSLLALFVALIALPIWASQIIIPAPPSLGATAYLLIDAQTGDVLVENNAKMPLPPASLTKMMTTYILSEEIEQGRIKETDLIRISDDAWVRGGSKSGSSTMFLSPRTEVPVIDLMRGIIIQSGNDASIAVAQHIAGSEDAFADVMNQQAQLLGMVDTHFKNATGWPAEGHITTASDLAILARASIYDHPEHYKIYSEREFSYNQIRQPNRNKLLFTDKYVDGLKTGHTNEAGYGLVASAEKDGMRLISVVLGARSEAQRASESKQLLAFGFRYYQTHNLYKTSDVLSTSKVWGGLTPQLNLRVKNDVVATIPRGSHKNLKAETQIDSVIKAPVKQGQVMGTLTVRLDDELIAEEELVAMEDIQPAGFFARTWDAILLMMGGADE